MSWNPIQRSASLQCTFSECHIFCLIVFDYNFQMITHFFLTNLELVTQSLCQSVTFSGCHIACASYHFGKILLGWWLCLQCLLWWLVVVGGGWWWSPREKSREQRGRKFPAANISGQTNADLDTCNARRNISDAHPPITETIRLNAYEEPVCSKSFRI